MVTFQTTKPDIRVYKITEATFPTLTKADTLNSEDLIHQSVFTGESCCVPADRLGSRFLAQPGSHSDLLLSFPMPRGLRSVYATGNPLAPAGSDAPLFEISFVVAVEIGLSSAVLVSSNMWADADQDGATLQCSDTLLRIPRTVACTRNVAASSSTS
jgi:hypothetical protein